MTKISNDPNTKTILMCDDNIVQRKIFTERVAQIDSSFTVLTFEDGVKLLEKLKELGGSCHTVVTDQVMDMSPMCGLDVVKKINELGYKCKKYILTDSNIEYFKGEAINVGADGIFSGQDMQAFLEKILK